MRGDTAFPGWRLPHQADGAARCRLLLKFPSRDRWVKVSSLNHLRVSKCGTLCCLSYAGVFTFCMLGPLSHTPQSISYPETLPLILPLTLYPFFYLLLPFPSSLLPFLSPSSSSFPPLSSFLSLSPSLLLFPALPLFFTFLSLHPSLAPPSIAHTPDSQCLPAMPCRACGGAQPLVLGGLDERVEEVPSAPLFTVCNRDWVHSDAGCSVSYNRIEVSKERLFERRDLVFASERVEQSCVSSPPRTPPQPPSRHSG